MSFARSASCGASVSPARPLRSRSRAGAYLESLESRRLLSVAVAQSEASPSDALTQSLTVGDVQKIIARAASQASKTQIISVVDRNGEILGVFAMNGAKLGAAIDQNGKSDVLIGTITQSIARARTAAAFESTQDAFTTRTARFIIQNHFPPGVPNTPGGPLYGVEFSALPGTDVAPGSALSGDPGGIPLFKDGVPVGAIGVAGDGSDVLALEEPAKGALFPGLPYNPKFTDPTKPYMGVEESDFDEAVAQAGAHAYMAPAVIRASNIFINGLRLPFVAEAPASAKPFLAYSQISSLGHLVYANATNTGGLNLEAQPLASQTRPTAAIRPGPPNPYPVTKIDGVTGLLKNTNPAASDFGIVAGAKHKNGVGLTTSDVNTIIQQAVAEALITRAGIRQPLGVNARIHIAVVDTLGHILGVFDMLDGTNFSYDVAVQKARTASYFSDDTHAITTTAIGFMSQKYFPPGIIGGTQGPLFGLQNDISLGSESPTLPLADGITIFPGGVPLYKNGVLVGAIGVSGDGVTQDDMMAFAGTANFRPKDSIKSDELTAQAIDDELTAKLNNLAQNIYPETKSLVAQLVKNLPGSLQGVRLPYVNFPRNPLV